MTDYTARLDEDGVAIFLFHGVIRQQRHAIRNYTRKHLVRERFVSILQDVRAAGVPVSMPDVASAIRGQAVLPARAFAVTFDDGFENNVSVAAPVLRELGIPATFYVTTGFVDSNGASWTDLIESAVERARAVRLQLPFPDLGGSCETKEEKLKLLDGIRQHVKSDPRIDPYELAGGILSQLGVAAVESDQELDQKMSWQQVAELSRDPLFTIGGHGHTHRILEYLSDAELEREVALSVETLRRHVEAPIEHYSYPEGLSSCYSERVIEVLRRHGIRCAVTAEPGINRMSDDLFRLKRIAVT